MKKSVGKVILLGLLSAISTLAAYVIGYSEDRDPEESVETPNERADAETAPEEEELSSDTQ